MIQCYSQHTMMNKSYHCGFPIYEFSCPKHILEEVCDQVRELEYVANANNLVSNLAQNKFYYHKELFDFFDHSLEQVRQIYYTDTIRLSITSCWANRTEKLNTHHKHVHVNSILSGIMYLTSHDSGHTVFRIPDPYLNCQRTGMLAISKQGNRQHVTDALQLGSKIKPEKGKLVIFPSHIEHEVTANVDSIDRYTLAFNTFITGKVSINHGTTYLHVNTVDVKQTIDDLNK